MPRTIIKTSMEMYVFDKGVQWLSSWCQRTIGTDL